MTTRTAECGCGRLTVTVEGEPGAIIRCSCDFCQKRTGSVFMVSAVFPEGQVVATAGDTKIYNGMETDGVGMKLPGVGELAVQYRFCPTCGSTVYWTVGGGTDINIAVGNFVDPTFPSPTMDFNTSLRHKWIAALPDAASYETYPGAD